MSEAADGALAFYVSVFGYCSWSDAGSFLVCAFTRLAVLGESVFFDIFWIQ